MDYGSYLKRSGVRLNSKSKHYIKQKKFKGSNRELRGAILRELIKKPMTLEELSKKLSRTKKEAARGCAQLVRDGLLKKKGSRYSVA
jgi:A/G-specific adenine glycosylase